MIGFKENRVYRLVNIFYFELRNHDQPFPREQYNRETLGRLERRFSPRALSITTAVIQGQLKCLT